MPVALACLKVACSCPIDGVRKSERYANSNPGCSMQARVSCNVCVLVCWLQEAACQAAGMTGGDDSTPMIAYADSLPEEQLRKMCAVQSGEGLADRCFSQAC
jgi:hypothetical protein